MIEELEKVAKWYYEVPKDFTGIMDLIHARKKVVLNKIHLARDVAIAKQEYLEAYATRKRSFAQIKYNAIEKGESASKAVIKAENETSELLDIENKLDGVYAKYKILLSEYSDLSDQLKQHISFLKQEKVNL